MDVNVSNGHFLDARFVPGTTKLNQSQTSLIFASTGHLAVSAGICSCHSLRVWLARARDISGHHRMLKGLNVIVLKQTGKFFFFFLMLPGSQTL